MEALKIHTDLLDRSCIQKTSEVIHLTMIKPSHQVIGLALNLRQLRPVFILTSEGRTAPTTVVCGEPL